MTFTTFSNQVGTVVKARGPSSWFSPHMAAAARAIANRIHLVDFAVEVRDARIPLSSAFEPMKHISCAHRRIILLNKADLSDHSKTEKWIEHLRENDCYCYAVNAHNKENIKQLINFSRARIREMGVDENYTATFMLMGIPNVGKSALVNALHQIGRISAEEKGKLKHADVTSRPGYTKDISSYKIASHPNIYVLDTPGVLPREMIDLEVGSKLALTGANDDSLIGVNELAQYFLALLNLGDQYKCWQKLNAKANEESDLEEKCQTKSHPGRNMKRRYPSDHTQGSNKCCFFLCESPPTYPDHSQVLEEIIIKLDAIIALFGGKDPGPTTGKIAGDDGLQPVGSMLNFYVCLNVQPLERLQRLTTFMTLQFPIL